MITLTIPVVMLLFIFLRHVTALENSPFSWKNTEYPIEVNMKLVFTARICIKHMIDPETPTLTCSPGPAQMQ